MGSIFSVGFGGSAAMGFVCLGRLYNNSFWWFQGGSACGFGCFVDYIV